MFAYEMPVSQGRMCWLSNRTTHPARRGKNRKTAKSTTDHTDYAVFVFTAKKTIVDRKIALTKAGIVNKH